MAKRYAAVAFALLITAGCTARTIETSAEPAQDEGLPPEVAAIAAPGQNLASARFRPEDGCYWYDYAGPVETTTVPLRAANGNQICNAVSA